MRLQRPSEVAEVEAAGTVYVANVWSGPIVVLEGSAAVIWQQAMAGDLETIPDRVAAITGADLDLITPEVEGFVRDLVGRGLLNQVS